MTTADVRDNLFIPLPLASLSKDLRRQHLSLRPIVDKLIDDYVKESGKGFAKLNELLEKLMEDELDLNSITEADRKEFEAELEKIDKRFQPVLKTIWQLNWNERRDLFLEQGEALSTVLRKTRSGLLKDLKKKSTLTREDYIFYSYFVHFVPMLDILTDMLDASNKENVDARITVLSMFLLIYGPVITSYFQGKLRLEVLAERLSEIATIIEPIDRKISSKIKKALDDIEDIPPIETMVS
ncbi:MAG: hypothetical protein M1113_00595 [Candidatus Thermoplasmatota archaeon]|jgi:hypothetical protein|nr:hypothetical protein [Candidatus Thermoplasmatota archaeon]